MNRRAITACALALALAAMSGKVALAQDRGRDRRPDTTRGQPDTTPEAPNGADAQGGHTTTDADRAIIERDRQRQAAEQAERDRQAAQGRSPAAAPGRPPADDQGRQGGRDRSDDQGREGGWDRRDDQGREGGRDRRSEGGREAPNGADWQGRHTPNEADRQVIRQNQFNDRDREVTRDWYRQNHRRLGPGWRQRDRLPPYMQRRLRRGYRLDPEMRREIHWLPPELSRRYGPAPRGYRYAIIGGNVVMLDDAYEVQDVFSITLRF